MLTGLDRAEVGACCCRAWTSAAASPASPPTAAAAEVLRHPALRAHFQAVADRLWAAGTGSANRVARLHLMAEPPSIDKGEITDKGSINQRAVLAHRAALVEALYGGDTIDVIVPRRSG